MSVRKEGDATDRFQMKVPVSVKEQGGGGFGPPDYSKAYQLDWWDKGGKNVVMPDDGWIYIRDNERTVDYSRHSGNLPRTPITMNPPASYQDHYVYSGWGGGYWNAPSADPFNKIVLYTQTFPGQRSRWGSGTGGSIGMFPVYKGQKIYVHSPDDDGVYIFFIPCKK